MSFLYPIFLGSNDPGVDELEREEYGKLGRRV